MDSIPALESRPLGKVTYMAVGRDELFVATAESSYVDIYSLGGSKLRAVAVDVAPRAATEQDYAAAIEHLVSMLSRDSREASRRMLASFPMPEHVPVYSGVHVAPDGTLWVNIAAPGDPVTRLRGVRPDGSRIGDLVIPQSVRVFEFGADYILGAVPWEDGTQRLAMFTLRWTEALADT